MGFFDMAIRNGANVNIRQKGRTKPKKATPEKTVQDAIMDFLYKDGWVVIRINSSFLWSEQTGTPVRSYLIYGPGMSSGLNDLIATKNNKALFIEVKAPGGRLSEAQQKVKKYMEERGTAYHVCDSVEQVKRLLG